MAQPLNTKKMTQTANPAVADPGDGYSVVSASVKSQSQPEERKDQKQPAPSQHSDSSHSYLDVLYDEWLTKLKTVKVFGDTPPETWVVGYDNLKEVLGVWNMPAMPHVRNEAIKFLANQPNNEVSCQRFCNHLVEFFRKAPPHQAEAAAFQTTAQIITDMLKEMQCSYLSKDREAVKMTKRIAHAIEALNSKKTLFQIEQIINDSSDEEDVDGDDLPQFTSLMKKMHMSKIQSQPQPLEVSNHRERVGSQTKTASFKRRHSLQVGTNWLQEYSQFNMSALQSRIIQTHKSNAEHTASKAFSVLSPSSSKKEHSYDTMAVMLEKNEQLFSVIDKFDFDMFAFEKQIGRQNALPYLVMGLVHKLPFDLMNSLYNEQKMVHFLHQITKGYQKDVAYHNDLHGADVAQMAYMFIKEGQLLDFYDLEIIDCIALIIASACHDYDHDGMNNAYHVNAMTTRAIRYHDEAVQENYHAAESLTVLLNPDNNFLENHEKADIKMFRKRMVGFILATDMAKHMEDLTSFKNKCELKGICKSQNNASLFIDKSDDSKRFNTQQQFLELLAHASDVSQATRSFETVKSWTYLLFEEFFQQGDQEREEGLPISFLCDRNTTNIPTNQPGFANFIVIPLYSAVTEALPAFQTCLDQVKSNVQNWQNYTESKNDENVYHSRKSKVVLVKVGSLDSEVQMIQGPVMTIKDRFAAKALQEQIAESNSESSPSSRSSSSDPSHHPPEGRASISNDPGNKNYTSKRHKKQKSMQKGPFAKVEEKKLEQDVPQNN